MIRISKPQISQEYNKLLV